MTQAQDIIDALGDLREATLWARTRTGEQRLAVAVQPGGFFAVNIVDPQDEGDFSDVFTLADHLTLDMAVSFLSRVTFDQISVVMMDAGMDDAFLNGN